MHAEPLDLCPIDFDAEACAGRERDHAAAQWQRVAHDVFGQIEVGEAHAPIDVRYRAGELDRGVRGNASFVDLGGDIQLEAEAPAELRGFERRRDAAEL